MKTQLVMLNTPIIASDEEIREGDYILTDKNITGKVIKVSDNGIGIEIKIIRKDNNLEYYPLTCKKIIAGIEGLPSIDWNGLEEEFGWVDIKYICEGIVDSETSADIDSPYRKTLEKYTMLGFKKAQSLNEKKFSLEDMQNAISFGVNTKYTSLSIKGIQTESKKFIQSLQQPKVFDIEVEMYRPNEAYQISEHWSPKITNNSIKILRKL